MDDLLVYKNVTISYNGVPQVRDISFALRRGQVLGIVGGSGSGKSSLLRAAVGLLGTGGAVTAGEITYRGQSLLGLREAAWQRLRGSEISLLFQDAAASLVPVMTVGEQVWASLSAHGAADRAAVRQQALELFGRLRFTDPEGLWQSYPCQLSGGMAQRVCIALALLLRPRLLLADEPTSALDVIAQRQVIEELRALQRQNDLTMVIVSHDPAVVRALADRVIVITADK